MKEGNVGGGVVLHYFSSRSPLLPVALPPSHLLDETVFYCLTAAALLLCQG